LIYPSTQTENMVSSFYSVKYTLKRFSIAKTHYNITTTLEILRAFFTNQ